MKANGSKGGNWFETLPGTNAGALKLFCFPHAGGSSQIFRGWQQYLSPEIALCLSHLPGRGMRIGERPFTNIKALVAALADALAPQVQRPFSFWGHSMGALISFELARELRRRNQPGPLVLLVSGRGAPHCRDAGPPKSSLHDSEFLTKLRELQGTPEELLTSPDLRAFFLPMIRADFELVETYAFEPARLLECPIFAYGGFEDKHVTPQALAGWKQHTVQSASCKVRMFPGGHFFLQDRISDMAQLLRLDILEVLARAENSFALYQ